MTAYLCLCLACLPFVVALFKSAKPDPRDMDRYDYRHERLPQIRGLAREVRRAGARRVGISHRIALEALKGDPCDRLASRTEHERMTVTRCPYFPSAMKAGQECRQATPYEIRALRPILR